jgi:purine-binding chemotaxis protein CheW
MKEATVTEGLVVFRLGEERYGVPMSCVRELARVPLVTPVPGMPRFVAGVANLRGSLIGLVELGEILGTAGVLDGVSRRMMILSVEGITAGVLVDAVEGVADLDSELDPPVPTLPDPVRTFVRGHLQRPEGSIAVLEPSLVPALRQRILAELG